MEKKADIVFEVSWEVCNKVGGIFTVVKSKAARMVENYGDGYFLVGPYFAKQTAGQFHEEPPSHHFKAVFDDLKKEGIICHLGKWIGDGNPNVILVDFESYRGKANEIKGRLWEWYKIDSIRAASDYDEPVIWAYTVGILLEKLIHLYLGKKIIAQFHEWLSGAGLLYLKKRNAKIATVFTTHATILGRTLASSRVDLYNVWDKIKPEEEAYNYGIESKFLVEKCSAIFADAFTTVSEITGMEAEYLLGRKPDVLLPNGLDISKFPTFEELVIKHKLQRDRIREFMLYHFFPYYQFDPRNTLILFTAARYEFHDKGFDIYIKALGKLNEKLKKEKNEKTIVAFLWVPANFRNVKVDILENKTLYQDIKDALEEVMDDVEKNIIYNFVSNKKISREGLFEEDLLTEMKIRIGRFAKKGTPPLATHDMYDENDIILKSLKEANLNNLESDPVKVVYYPIYLSGADGLLNLNYYEAMQGSHLGVFPSYYEPWGYTPLEAGALGVSSVTTDLAGFGRFFCNECVQPEIPGIFVLRRLNKSDDDVTGQLVDVMLNFINMSREDRVANKMQARRAASMADWKSFVGSYIACHNLAVSKFYK